MSYNAIANLGYADVRFMAPVYAGDTITCESLVIGTKENSDGRSGVVYVRSRAFNQERVEVLAWTRWVIVAMRPARSGERAGAPAEAALPPQVDVASFRVAGFPRAAALQPHHSGRPPLWEG